MDLTDLAFRNFVVFMEMVDDQGEAVSRHFALEVIDDILSSGLRDGEARGMIRTIVNGALRGEIDDEGTQELDKTRIYLAGKE